jgi:hypothetical protein
LADFLRAGGDSDVELLEALRTRKSIRAVKPGAVLQNLITPVLEASPPEANTQPWGNRWCWEVTR